jgi:hypothetical protein
VNTLRALGSNLVLISPASGHCIRHYESPFHSIEASLLHPNDSIHDFASSTAGRIPAENNSSYSQHVQDRWTDDDVLQGCEGTRSFEPLGILDDLSFNGDSCIQDDDPMKCIDPRLTIMEHESQNFSPSVTSQPAPEALAQSFRSQSLSYPILPEIQRVPLAAYTEIWQDLDPYNFHSLSFPTSTHWSPFQPASPTSSEQVSSDAPDGKMEIVATCVSYMCPTCQKSFTTDRQYKNHVGALGCHTSFNCHDCGQNFKQKKDLQRHRGHTKAASSCSKGRTVGIQVKPFACTCKKAYPRKDSLLRHLRRYASETPRRHRCKACSHVPCSCS